MHCRWDSAASSGDFNGTLASPTPVSVESGRKIQGVMTTEGGQSKGFSSLLWVLFWEPCQLCDRQEIEILEPASCRISASSLTRTSAGFQPFLVRGLEIRASWLGLADKRLGVDKRHGKHGFQMSRSSESLPML